MNWESYLNRIENPDHPAMQDLLATARENVRGQLLDEGAEEIDEGTLRYRGTELDEQALTKFAYAFYYDWERDPSPKFVFLVQNPGPLVNRRHLDDEAEELLEAVDADNPYLTQVRINRGYLKDWLWRRNGKFSENFFPLLSEHGLIEYESLEHYLEGGFYADFALTDVVKYRVRTSAIDGGRGGNAEVSYEDFLAPELEALDPDLIFSFGSRCWRVLYRNLDVTPVDGDEALTNSVTNAHGYAFQYDGGYIIPLTHFSGRNTFLRNSYYEYLSEGLDSFASVRF